MNMLETDALYAVKYHLPSIDSQLKIANKLKAIELLNNTSISSTYTDFLKKIANS